MRNIKHTAPAEVGAIKEVIVIMDQIIITILGVPWQNPPGIIPLSTIIHREENQKNALKNTLKTYRQCMLTKDESKKICAC